jgi:hypothetical protein
MEMRSGYDVSKRLEPKNQNQEEDNEFSIPVVRTPNTKYSENALN